MRFSIGAVPQGGWFGGTQLDWAVTRTGLSSVSVRADGYVQLRMPPSATAGMYLFECQIGDATALRWSLGGQEGRVPMTEGEAVFVTRLDFNSAIELRFDHMQPNVGPQLHGCDLTRISG